MVLRAGDGAWRTETSARHEHRHSTRNAGYTVMIAIRQRTGRRMTQAVARSRGVVMSRGSKAGIPHGPCAMRYSAAVSASVIARPKASMPGQLVMRPSRLPSRNTKNVGMPCKPKRVAMAASS